MAKKKATAAPETDAQAAEKRKLAEVATKWNKAISKRRKQERPWRDQGDKVLRRYRDERDLDQDVAKFAILWANTEVMKPAIFSRMPVPDVRRRFLTKDAVARTAAMIMERALSFTMDTQDFRDTLDRALEDYLLPGRAQAICTYKPYFDQEKKSVEPLPPGDTPDDKPQYPEGTEFDDAGAAFKMQERKVWEEVRIKYQPWRYYCFGKAVQRAQVPWEAYGELLSETEVPERFAGFKNAKDLAYSTDYEEQDKDDKDNAEKKCLVWTIWDEHSRTVISVAQGYNVAPLEIVQDPLGLENFFPAPEPMYALRTNGNDLPKPEFLMYQDQANELDILCARQRALASALKYRGVYDKQLDENAKISDLVKAPDNTFIGVSNYSQLAEKGGLEALIDTLPIEEIQQALEWITGRIDLLKQEIYEIYGISDIVRGSTKASETLGAQQLKAQYAGMRISTRQERFQRFIRDLLRIVGEVIVEHFDPQTLQIMSGVQVMPDAEYAMAKQQMNLDSGAVSATDYIAACQLLKSDKLRGFKIDIETDSTVPVDKATEQQNRVQFMQAIGQYLAGVIPAVESGAIPIKMAREGLLFVVRGFKVGSELEETLEELGSGQDEAQQLSQMKQAQAQAQQQIAELTKENQDLKSDAAAKQQDAQVQAGIDTFKAQNDVKNTNMQAANDARIKEAAAAQDLAIKARDAHHEAIRKQQQSQHDEQIKSVQAQADGHRKALEHHQKQQQAAQKDQETKATATNDTHTKAIQSLMESQQKQTEMLGALIQQIAKPRSRRGTAMLPDGRKIELATSDEEPVLQ